MKELLIISFTQGFFSFVQKTEKKWNVQLFYLIFKQVPQQDMQGTMVVKNVDQHLCYFIL